jgi:hypothetical protein
MLKARPMIATSAAAIMLMVSSCSTPYQQQGFRGGYSDARIAQDTVLVSFKGNGHTSKERVQLFLLYRCAQVTKQYGYDYFIVSDGGTDDKTSFVNTSSTYNSTTTASAFGGGNTAFGSSHTFGSISPGQTIPIHKYAGDALIKMYKGQKPSNDPNAYDAEETIKYLGPQLGIGENEQTVEK